MKTQYKITENGFICLYHDGVKTSTHFYHPGDELDLEKYGYERVDQVLYQNGLFDLPHNPRTNGETNAKVFKKHA